MKISGVILDLDGTLIDSMQIWHEIDVQFFTENGLAVPDGISEKVAKMSIQEWADFFVSEYMPDLTTEYIIHRIGEMAEEYYQNIKLALANKFTLTYPIDYVQKEFETVDKYLDEFVLEIAKANNVEIKYKEDLEIPVEGYDKQKDFKDYQDKVQREIQQAGMGTMPNVNALYCDSA